MLACVCVPLSTYFFLQVQSLPKPFPIPVFRGATEANLEKKLLVDTDRKYMVQVLSTVLMVHVQRPSLAECGVVAKQLISKYPFLNDDEGDGEVRSFNYNMLTK